MALMVTLTLIPLTNANAESGTFSVLDYGVDYDIEGGELITMDLDVDFAALAVEIVSLEDGFIELVVPRGLVDSTFSETEDDIFYVIIDGIESHYLEVASSTTARTLIIPYFAGDELIEIFGTDVLTAPPVMAEPQPPIVDEKEKTDDTKKMQEKETVTEEGGGCLIATAAYGSEMASQVQFLREIRDNTVLSTSSGTSFMNSFNQFYYSFSPTIADWERQNPVFKELTKLFITPMISTLSIMTLAEEGSESHVLSLGIAVIGLNLGMYIAAPTIAIWKFKQAKFGINKNN